MKTLFLFFISFNIYGATRVETCGVFDVYGEIKNTSPGHYSLIVNGGSISEYKFALQEPKQEFMSVTYLDRAVKARVVISRKIKGYQGIFNSIEKIEETVPDPAYLTKNHGFFLVKKEKCK